ncbi:hypothetical protein D3C87_1798070 [compost metagenome]
MVEPGFQGAGDRKVVHGRGHDQYIGGEQFVGQLVGAFQGRLFDVAALLGGFHPATQQVDVQMRHRLDGQVPDGDLVIRVSGFPLADEGLGQLTGNRVLLTGTAFDDQNAGHGM